MNFIHSRELLNEGDVVVVNCDYQCNVMLTTDSNFQRYRSGQRFEYFGGHYKRFPVRLRVPSTGHWNVTIDLGGGSANIRYSINFVKNS
ncbi:DUF1883 domain-containing protein [Burkholderia pseudomallei]|uniref:DUF1883 domain-containing protein n=1 Tax=pseudomallei group TaxID=111527 RepID=UPI0009774822|nr:MULTISPECIES: DUF1883 domain-containing protein [pseudomallei group]MBF3700235.1 DUF1883 domain-containing protein [Burkholderia pseudomallei]MBF3721608.1 DUF1883 domain-containing protein [Burkholderia pseudomallei]MBF4044452.1 DUF1883 domain-containing protein [Burkholderia pseudomallei]MUV27957.1 DUF1883 domain-containing protein [Burkholderia thailandensis]CAJ8563464.1 Domain of uncharacterised function (DUF1883) [Burkholderia pseudomallei]